MDEILLEYLHSIDPHWWPGMDGLTLDVVLDCYCRAARAGHVPGKDELLRLHPEFAEDLAVLFADREGTPEYHSSSAES
jgi:hypothetical protein